MYFVRIAASAGRGFVLRTKGEAGGFEGTRPPGIYNRRAGGGRRIAAYVGVGSRRVVPADSPATQHRPSLGGVFMFASNLKKVAALFVAGAGLFAMAQSTHAQTLPYPPYNGTTLVVDDDKVQCPTAGYSTIQSAVDAASSAKEDTLG